jgi:hypothetical protein
MYPLRYMTGNPEIIPDPKSAFGSWRLAAACLASRVTGHVVFSRFHLFGALIMNSTIGDRMGPPLRSIRTGLALRSQLTTMVKPFGDDGACPGMIFKVHNRNEPERTCEGNAVGAR